MRYVIIIIAVGQDCVTILEIRLKMTKESDARENIDRLLEQAGWSVCDAARASIHAARGVAIREFPLKSGHGFAVGVCEQDKTDSHPVGQKPTVSFEKLMQAVMFGNTEDDVLSSLAGRLARMEHRLTHEEAVNVTRMQRSEIR